MRRGTYTVLWDDLEFLVHALRVAGFAAWRREYGELCLLLSSANSKLQMRI